MDGKAHGFSILDSIYSDSSKSLYVVDQNFKVQYVNKALCDITGFEKEELLNDDISKFINHPKDKTFNFNLKFQTEVRVTAKNRKKHTVDLTVHSIIQNGTITGFTGVFAPLDQDQCGKEREEILKILQKKDAYHQKQQDNAFLKQLRIIQNDLDHSIEKDALFQAYYKPLDILSGDTYGTAALEEGKSLFYIVDAMGKGLSAAITSIQSSSFINHGIKKAKENRDLDFPRLVESYIDFIKEKLLEKEIVSIIFLYIDEEKDRMSVANFGMPPLLVEKIDGDSVTIEEIRANNLPIMFFTKEDHIDTLRYSSFTKILLKSDGFEESTLKESIKPYADNILDDFKNSFTAKSFIDKFSTKTQVPKDDLTMVLISKIPQKYRFSQNYEIDTDPGLVDKLLEQIEQKLENIGIPHGEAAKIKFSLTELVLNAIEHGNLGIDNEEKNILIAKKRFDGAIEEKIKDIKIKEKKVRVSVKIFNHKSDEIVSVQVSDQGNGFDAANYLKYMGFNKNYSKLNGRGILLTENLNDGIYFNKKGNEVTLIKVIEGRLIKPKIGKENES